MGGAILLVNNMNEFNEMLLEALKDEKIVEAIENIFNIKRSNLEKSIKIEENIIDINNSVEDKYNGMIEKNKELTYKIENINSENRNLKDKNIELLENLSNSKELHKIQVKELESNYKLKLRELEERENNLKSINIELKNQVSNLNNQVMNLKNEFKDIRIAYSVYVDLEESIKKQLDGIFKERSIENFLYCGVQYKSIESLWEYIKILSINGKIENLIELNNIFIHLFNAHNKIYKTPLYKMQEVKIGQIFDEDKFTRGYNSKINGAIQEIYVNGYINLNTNSIVKKSVVRV